MFELAKVSSATVLVYALDFIYTCMFSKDELHLEFIFFRFGFYFKSVRRLGNCVFSMS